MFARYFGGEKADYEAIDADNTGGGFQDGHPYDGTGEMWDEAKRLVRAGGRANDTFNMAKTHIDIADYIDFMIMWASGNSESEFRSAGGFPTGDTPQSPLRVPFKFFLKDADGYLRGHNASRTTHQGPLNLFRELRSDKDPEYLTLIGDRLHKHFFNGGAMTTERLVNRLQKRVDEIKVSFIAEAARWNFRPYDGRSNSWSTVVNGYLTRTLPRVESAMIQAYERAGLYPEVPAPVFSQHGGTIPADGNVRINADGVIYYTTDGSDPRLIGGSVNPSATAIGREPVVFFEQGASWKYLDDGSDQGTAWRSADYDDGAWKEGVGEFGYGDRDEATVVEFGDSPSEKHITTYFRKSFEAANVERMVELSVHLLRDDGAVVYINGQEVVRDNLPEGEVTFTTPAPKDGRREEDVFYDYEVDPSVLVNGTNVIAVEVHNESTRSSDLSFHLTLDGFLSTGIPNIPLTGPTTLKARVLDGEDWSALNEAFFSPAATGPSNENLVISEFMYNPAPPTEAEISAGITNADRFEYIELYNIGGQTLDLTDLEFTDGIGAKVLEGPHAFLGSGKHAVLVKDADAFAVRYGTSANVIGIFTGNLRNSGESVILESPGSVIRSFTYDDSDPWPVEADGDGNSLELVDPSSNPDHNVAANWTAGPIGGTPGRGEGDPEPDSFATWKASVFTAEELNDPAISGDGADAENDGLSVFLEYALGGSPSTKDHDLGLEVTRVGEEIRISHAKSKTAGGVTFALEQSVGLANWEPADGQLVAIETVSISDTSNRISFRYTGGADPNYFRLKVQQ